MENGVDGLSRSPEEDEATVMTKLAYDQEIKALEMRGERLRRAAFAAGVCQVLSVISSTYTIFAIRRQFKIKRWF